MLDDIVEVIVDLLGDALEIGIDHGKKSKDQARRTPTTRTPTQSPRARSVKKKKQNKDLEPWEWEYETPPWEK